MPENTLLIVPDDYHRVPRDVPALLAGLRAQGLLGNALAHDRYEVGAAFPRLLSFMGCSPYFKTEPEHPDDHDFCHLELRGPWPEPRLLGRLEDASPRCPRCRKPDRGWDRDGDPPAPADAWSCPHCSFSTEWGELDWRGRAGFTRFALVLHHVFESEAVPGPELLKTLKAHADGAWVWFYG